ncbi:MAG: methyltransferase domain-containing protein [Verrucomicrobiota bacterium]
MGDSYLATGFRDVDGSGAASAYLDCLRLLDSLPYFREYKEESYEWLGLGEGDRVLDAGCGLGDDVFRMAERVGEGGRVVGVDCSRELLEKGRSDERAKRLPVEFVHGDLGALPFEVGVFGAVRVDRVLQHVPGLDEAFREFWRVLETGGRLLVYDNDWGSFAVASDLGEVTRVLERSWAGAFANPGIGRELEGRFEGVGFGEVSVRSKVMVIEDFETADRVFNLRETVRRAVDSGFVKRAEGEQWESEMEVRSVAGNFSASLTAYMVRGRKG